MTDDRFPRAYKLERVTEGGYVNHPDDPGGATNKGVTQRTYNAYRKRRGQDTRDVRRITDAEVETIYRNQYWNAVKADALPDGVAYCVFDAAINSGPGQAAEWLQEIIGVKVDGVVGDETISAAREANPVALINEYCDRRWAFMKRLKHFKTFEDGWKRRVAEVRAQSINWAQAQPVPASRENPQPKAEGREKITSTIRDAARKPSVWTVITGLIASPAIASGSGPVPYAVAAVLVIAALTGVWWLVRGREA